MRSSYRTERGTHDARLRGGFTLTEMLVVILIIILISAATIPAVLPALNSRKVSEGSRILQSELARARDAAVRANAPRGFRLVPDPADPLRPVSLTCSRILPIEPAPDYSDGMIHRFVRGQSAIAGTPESMIAAAMINAGFITSAPQTDQLLMVREAKVIIDPIAQIPVPGEPTSWYWNIRQGDRIQLSETGRYYTVIGPMRIGPKPNASLPAPDNTMTNPERFINFGSPSNYLTGPTSANIEFLILTDGVDDPVSDTIPGNGFTDECFDGIDNDRDGVIDPAFDGLDNDGNGVVDDINEFFFNAFAGLVAPPFGEFELESFQGNSRSTNNPQEYTITRRPVPSEGAREILMPTNVVIDLTTALTALPERSRLPVDPATGFVDVLIAPNGQVVNAAPSANLAPPVAFPFYHFWICERDDVHDPFPASMNLPFQLPMPKGTTGDPRIGSAAYPATLQTLKGERRLLTVNTRTGAITPTAVETFYVNNPSYPYEAAEAGAKDVQP